MKKMARSSTLSNIKIRLKALKPSLSRYRLYLLPTLLLLFAIPLFYLLSHFKAQYSHANELIATLKKIHLSHERLSTIKKRHPLTLKSQLLSIAPLQSQKGALFSLKEHLPQTQCTQIEEFFAKNQLHLEKVNLESKNKKKLHHLKLMNPILIHPDQASELISLIESQEALAFNSFALEKKNPDDNLLTLDFTLTVYNDHA
jgi:hypothetical protein